VRWDYEFVDDGPFDVIAKTSGVATVEEMIEGRRSMYADPRLRPGVAILFDHTDLEGDLTAEENERVAAASSFDFEEYQIGYSVMVAPRAVAYGMIRMWQAFVTGPIRERSKVVRTVEEAYEWIEEIQGDG